MLLPREYTDTCINLSVPCDFWLPSLFFFLFSAVTTWVHFLVILLVATKKIYSSPEILLFPPAGVTFRSTPSVFCWLNYHPHPDSLSWVSIDWCWTSGRIQLNSFSLFVKSVPNWPVVKCWMTGTAFDVANGRPQLVLIDVGYSFLVASC